MADSEHDDEFEAYLKRRVPIDQRMKTVDRLEPPPEIDRIIIGKARNAIQNSPQVPLYRAPKWALPVGLAATLLIAFSIVLNLGIRSSRHQPQSAPAVAQVSASEAREPKETRAAPAPAPTAPSASTRQGVAAAAGSSGTNAPAAAGTGSNAAASAKVFTRTRPPPIKTAPWPPLRRAEKPAAPADAASGEGATTTESAAEFDPRSRSAERRVAEKRLRTDDSQRVAAAAADVSSPAAQDAAPAPAAPPPRPLVDATANAGAPAPLRLAASSPQVSAATFDSVKVTKPRSAERFNSASGGGGPAPRTAAPAVVPSPTPAPQAAAASAVAPPAAAAPSAVAPLAVAADSAAAASVDRREHPDPKVWLDQIQKLRVAGLRAQAEQELKHFRDAYPGYGATHSAPDGSTQ